MKRWIFAIALLAASGALANVLYRACRPSKSDEECSMDWLTEQLALTAAQRETIWSVHASHCPILESLCEKLLQCAPATAGDARQTCQQATQQLIAEVCAKLTPVQREKYLRLVSVCLPPAAPATPQATR